MNTDLSETIQLGKTDVRVPPLGIGTWQWGDSMMWGYGKGYAEGEIQAAFDASMAAGITCFDTAEMYGFGKSERFLGKFIRADGQPAGRRDQVFPGALAPGQGQPAPGAARQPETAGACSRSTSTRSTFPSRPCPSRPGWTGWPTRCRRA